MGKSIRSKSKRKFRAIRRKKIYAPAERKQRLYAASNLRRAVGSQRASKASVDELRAMLNGEAPTSAAAAAADGERQALPDASDALGMGKHREEMDAVEAEMLAKQNDHFNFMTKKIIEPWRVSGPTGSELENRIKEKEAEEAQMDVESSQPARIAAGKKKKRKKRSGGRRR